LSEGSLAFGGAEILFAKAETVGTAADGAEAAAAAAAGAGAGAAASLCLLLVPLNRACNRATEQQDNRAAWLSIAN
jgi:hypothetical protein